MSDWEVYDPRKAGIVLGVLGGVVCGLGSAVLVLATGLGWTVLVPLLLDVLVLVGTWPAATSRSGGITFVIASTVAFVIGFGVLLFLAVLAVAD